MADIDFVWLIFGWFLGAGFVYSFDRSGLIDEWRENRKKKIRSK
jgi:hypothetical protein